MKVVKHKALGLSEKQIADKLFNAIPTIKKHLQNARNKNGLKNSFELVARYAANNPFIFLLETEIEYETL